jgi:hypothetical protein
MLVGGSGGGASAQQTVTVVTHDSWVAPQEVLDAFEKQSGIKISVLKQGDAGALTNKLVLTKASPLGDVAYGVDSTFASRALSEGVFEPYTSPEADHGRSGTPPNPVIVCPLWTSAMSAWTSTRAISRRRVFGADVVSGSNRLEVQGPAGSREPGEVPAWARIPARHSREIR